MENGWKMEDGKWKPETGFITFGVARKPWRGSPGGRPEEAVCPTLPASGHLARLALRGFSFGIARHSARIRFGELFPRSPQDFFALEGASRTSAF